MQMIDDDRPLVADLVKGAIAGAAATWIMGQVTSYLYENEDPAAREREDEARGGRTAYGVAAEKGAALLGMELEEGTRRRLGAGIHWALGVGTGALYGVLRGRLPGADSGFGLPFGATFWAVVDEGANVALGLTPGPGEFPWQAHARGQTGHLVFGVAAESAMRVLDRVV